MLFACIFNTSMHPYIYMLLHTVPPRLFEPFSATLPSPASHFVGTITCLVIVISSNTLLRTIFVL